MCLYIPSTNNTEAPEEIEFAAEIGTYTNIAVGTEVTADSEVNITSFVNR